MWARGPGSDGSPHPGPFLATPSARPSASPPPGGLGNGRSQRGAGHPRRRAETPVLSFGGAMRVCAVNGSSPCTHPNLQARGARAEPRSSSPQQPDAPSPAQRGSLGVQGGALGEEEGSRGGRTPTLGAQCGRDCRQERRITRTALLRAAEPNPYAARRPRPGQGPPQVPSSQIRSGPTRSSNPSHYCFSSVRSGVGIESRSPGGRETNSAHEAAGDAG